jgi:hypothetical protein
MGKSDTNNNRITCPHCGEDITESVNRATASRAARAWHAKHDNEYYRELVNKRWAKKKATEGKQDPGTRGKDSTPHSTPQNDAIRRT